jgi:hypothetical protein
MDYLGKKLALQPKPTFVNPLPKASPKGKAKAKK